MFGFVDLDEFVEEWLDDAPLHVRNGSLHRVLRSVETECRLQHCCVQNKTLYFTEVFLQNSEEYSQFFWSINIPPHFFKTFRYFILRSNILLADLLHNTFSAIYKLRKQKMSFFLQFLHLSMIKTNYYSIG